MFYEEDNPEEQSETILHIPQGERDSITPLSFLEIIYGVFAQPRDTFRYLAYARPIKEAVGFLLIIILFNFVTSLPDYRAAAIGADLPIDISAFIVPLFLIGLVVAFIAWFLNAATVNLVSQLVGGKGNGLGLLCGFSFAMAPVLITGILGSVMQLLPFRSLFTVPISMTGVVWVFILDIIALGEIEQLAAKKSILVYFAVPLSIMVSVLVVAGMAFAAFAPWLSQLPLQLR